MAGGQPEISSLKRSAALALSLCAAATFASAQSGTVGGVLSLLAGVPGTILGGALSDRFRRCTGRGGRMLFGALAAPLSIPM